MSAVTSLDKVFIGIDVGTGSARAGLFTAKGALLASARRAIGTWHEAGGMVEQSSEDIWAACAQSVREAMESAGVTPDQVKGIGFDATCSLVLVTTEGAPVSVSPLGEPARNIIVWMDHRATDQTRRINASGQEVLSYVGGVISPEMETPKLLWLKEKLPQAYAAAAHFFDLSDYLTWRATGSLARSVCTVTCKWTYLAHEKRWSDDYFRAIGLGDLTDEGYRRIGTEVVEPGTPLASGLTEKAARELGLFPGTAVGAALIDAHAGGVGTLGGRAAEGAQNDPRDRLGYIMGTSACLMASTSEPSFVPGIWGPYYSAMFPGLWLNEGGQSAAGAAIDHLLQLHPAYTTAQGKAEREGLSIIAWLEQRVTHETALCDVALLARDLHILPDFVGNRSPQADPDVRAVIAGLGLEEDMASLERLFVAGICGLGYGLADIVEALAANNVPCTTLVVSGGASRSALVRQILGDASGLEVVLPDTEEPVLLGAAMLGAVAAKAYPTIADAAGSMSVLGAATPKAPAHIRDFHAAKRGIHRNMQALDRTNREAMARWQPRKEN